MLYTPDYTLIEAKKVIDELDDSKLSRLIQYYIDHLNDRIKTLDDKNSEYKEFFTKLNSLLPRKNMLR